MTRMTSAQRARTVGARVALVVGALLCVGAILAGLANREVLDRGRFARHVDAIRMDRDVADQVGQQITDRVLQLDPDLVVLKPLIALTAARVVRSPAFTPIVVSAAAQLHGALTTPHSRQVILRLADVGALIVPALRALAPSLAAGLPPDFDVTLAHIGSQDFAARTISAAQTGRTLAWLLPLLALLCFALAIALRPDRARALAGVGVAIVCAGIGFGAVLLIGGAVVAAQPSTTLSGALVRAGWHQLVGEAWSSLAVIIVCGAVIAVVAGGWIRRSRLASAPVDAARWLAGALRATRSGPAQVLRVLSLAALGVLLILRPVGTVVALATVAGVGLVWTAVGQIGAIGRPREEAPTRQRPGRRAGYIALALAVVLLAALVAAAVRPTLGSDPAPAAAAPARTCNGFAALCSRRYDQVAYPGTHNSMSAADQPGWLFAEQPDGLVAQLQAGIRVLLFDTWMGQATQRPGIIANTNADRATALQVANQDLGAAAVASALRVQNLAGLTPTGPARPYLCHGVCEFGSTLWEPQMAAVKTWLAAHPREVATFFIQDEGVSPEQTDEVFRQAGLLPYVYTQPTGRPWPTLAEMIDSGRRLVVLMENQDGGTKYPWQLPGFTWTQDTPYNFTAADQFSCTRLRGKSDSPLFLVNHWLSNGTSRVSDSARVNSYDVLWRRVSDCERERGQIPNFVAVDFYDRGDLFGVVNRLNGVA